MLAFPTSSFLCSSSSALFINHHHLRALCLYESSSSNYSDADKYGLYFAVQEHNCKGRSLLCRTWKFLKAIATKSSQLLLCGTITRVGMPWLGEHYQVCGSSLCMDCMCRSSTSVGKHSVLQEWVAEGRGAVMSPVRSEWLPWSIWPPERGCNAKMEHRDISWLNPPLLVILQTLCSNAN